MHGLLPTPATLHFISVICPSYSRDSQAKPSLKQNPVCKAVCESSRTFTTFIDETDHTYRSSSGLIESNFSIILSRKHAYVWRLLKRGMTAEDPCIEISDQIDGEYFGRILENSILPIRNQLIFFMDAKQHISRISRMETTKNAGRCRRN
jgi:hypothetical protein